MSPHVSALALVLVRQPSFPRLELVSRPRVRPNRRVLKTGINKQAEHTVSIRSLSPPFSFSLVRSRALALAVVDSTAVATFSTVSLVGGLTGAGYANRAGRALDTNSNDGVYA